MRKHMLAVLVCLAVLAAPAFSQTDQCLSHFQESGSIFKGKVLDTYEEFAGLDVKTAMRRVEAALRAQGGSIESVDAEKGVIKIENEVPNSRPFPMEFTVTAAPSGVRVRLWFKMNAGQMIAGGTKAAVCEMIRLASVEPPPPPPPLTARAFQGADQPNPPATRTAAQIAEATTTSTLPSGDGWRSDAIEIGLGAGRWLKAINAGCTFNWPADARNVTLSWTGKCDSNGRATGEGVLTKKVDGIVDWQYRIHNNGYFVENGLVGVRIPAGTILVRAEPGDCRTRGIIAGGTVTVAKNIDIAEPAIARAVIHESIRLMNLHCPDSTYPEGRGRAFGLRISREGADVQKAEFHCEIWFSSREQFVDGNVFDTWRVVVQRQAQIHERADADRKAIREFQEKQQAAGASSAAAASQRHIEDGRAKLAKYGVTVYTTIDKLDKNVFRFQGKTVAIPAAFQKMLTASVGEFDRGPLAVLGNDAVIVSGLSAEQFKGQEYGLIVGRVLGNKKLDTGLGQAEVPELHFIGFVRCQQPDCGDQGFPHSEW